MAFALSGPKLCLPLFVISGTGGGTPLLQTTGDNQIDETRPTPPPSTCTTTPRFVLYTHMQPSQGISHGSSCTVTKRLNFKHDPGAISPQPPILPRELASVGHKEVSAIRNNGIHRCKRVFRLLHSQTTTQGSYEASQGEGIELVHIYISLMR